MGQEPGAQTRAKGTQNSKAFWCGRWQSQLTAIFSPLVLPRVRQGTEGKEHMPGAESLGLWAHWRTGKSISFVICPCPSLSPRSLLSMPYLTWTGSQCALLLAFYSI